MKLYVSIAIFFFAGILQAQKPERTITGTHTTAINCLAISFDASKAITGGADNRAYCWDMNTGSKLRSFAAQDDAITDAEYNNDQTLFATSSNNKTIVVWDAATYKPRKILKGHLAAVSSIAFHPFRDEMLSTANDGNVKLWDAANGKVLNENFITLTKTGFTYSKILYTKNSKSIGVAAGGVFALYQTDGTLIKEFSASPRALFDFCGDAKTAVFLNAAGKAELVNTETGNALLTLPADFSNATSLRFAQKANMLCVGRNNGSVEVYNIDEKKAVYTIAAHLSSAIVDAEISEDGNILITAASDLSIKKWNIQSLNLGYVVLPTQAAEGDLKINKPTLKDDNNNGLLDVNENATLGITLVNPSAKSLYDVYLRISSDNNLTGLSFPPMYFAGEFPSKGSKTFAIPLKLNSDQGAGSTRLTISVESGGTVIATETYLVQTASKSNAGVAVQLFRFFSPSGKATLGEPLTLQLTLENITGITAENVEVKYSFPEGITAIDKARETIAKLAPAERVNIDMQFMPSKSFQGSKMQVFLDISGVSYSNANDIKIELPVGSSIGTRDEFLAMKGGTAKPVAKPAETPADYGSGTSIEKTRYVALVIGINSYTGTWAALNNAVNDAKGVAAELQKSYNFSVVRTVYDKEATRTRLMNELEWCVENLTEKDNLVIFYSGHGEYKESLNKGFWVPVDALTNSTPQLLSNADLLTYLAAIKTKHTLLISDACFSGDITRGSLNYVEDADKFYRKAHSVMSRQAITSGGIEPVMDGGKDGHSIFTYYLLKALRENKAKFTDASRMFEYIKVPIVNNSDQSPKLSRLKNTGDEGGEFIFYRPQ